MVPKAVR